MEKLEKIEKLRERANVSYDEAKEALEASNNDLLDALIYLEEQGKVPRPQGDGYYSSQGQTNDEYKEKDEGDDYKKERKAHDSWRVGLERLINFVLSLIKKGNETGFEVLKEEEYVFSMPVTVLVILAIFLPMITFPALVIAYFFGYHYQIVGKD